MKKIIMIVTIFLLFINTSVVFADVETPDKPIAKDCPPSYVGQKKCFYIENPKVKTLKEKPIDIIIEKKPLPKPSDNPKGSPYVAVGTGVMTVLLGTTEVGQNFNQKMNEVESDINASFTQFVNDVADEIETVFMNGKTHGNLPLEVYNHIRDNFWSNEDIEFAKSNIFYDSMPHITSFVTSSTNRDVHGFMSPYYDSNYIWMPVYGWSPSNEKYFAAVARMHYEGHGNVFYTDSYKYYSNKESAEERAYSYYKYQYFVGSGSMSDWYSNRNSINPEDEKQLDLFELPKSDDGIIVPNPIFNESYPKEMGLVKVEDEYYIEADYDKVYPEHDEDMTVYFPVNNPENEPLPDTIVQEVTEGGTNPGEGTEPDPGEETDPSNPNPGTKPGEGTPKPDKSCEVRDFDKWNKNIDDISMKFPFSIPWDIQRAMEAIFGNIGDEKPQWKINDNLFGEVITITIPDFISDWMPFMHSLLLIIFDIGCIYAIRKWLGGSS